MRSSERRKDPFEPLRGVVEHRRQDVAIPLGHGDRRVAEDVLNDPQRSAGGQKIGGRAVTQVMRTVRRRQARRREQILERFVHRSGANRAAQLVGEDQIVVLPQIGDLRALERLAVVLGS